MKWILSFLVDAEPAAPLTKKRGGRSSYMDPFLSVVASAFPGRAGIFDYILMGSPQAAIPIGQRAERGEAL